MTAAAGVIPHFQQVCLDAGFPFAEAWLAPKALWCQLVEKARTNLIGDPTEAGVTEHWLEALAVAACVAEAGLAPKSVADVGAGAGLAAVVYALVWPAAQVYAVEPRRLRAEFVASAAVALQLPNLRVVPHTLHSALAAGALPAGIDVADARAVWPAADWLKRAQDLVRVGGLVALHGRGTAEEFRREVAQFGEVCSVRAVPGPRGHAVALVRFGGS